MTFGYFYLEYIVALFFYSVRFDVPRVIKSFELFKNTSGKILLKLFACGINIFADDVLIFQLS